MGGHGGEQPGQFGVGAHVGKIMHDAYPERFPLSPNMEIIAKSSLPILVDGEINQELIQWMMAGDTRGLQTIAEGNAESFWNSVMSDGNKRHVCGLSATYAALRLLEGSDGRVHKYGFAPDPAGGIVSFASMSFQPRKKILLP